MGERCDGYHGEIGDLSATPLLWLGNARRLRRCVQVAGSRWAFRELYPPAPGFVSFTLTAATIAGSGSPKRKSVGLRRRRSLGYAARSVGRAQSKSEKCEIAEIRLRPRVYLLLGRSAGYHPRPDPNQRAFRTCKEAMSNIWRWPVLKRKVAIRSRQRTTTSMPNIISDRCSPNRHNKRRLTQDTIDQAYRAVLAWLSALPGTGARA